MREYALIFLTAAVVTYLLTPGVRSLAIALGAMTEVRDRDVHTTPTPRLGGIAMFGGMVAALLLAWRLPKLSDIFEADMWVALMLAGGVIAAVGIADDKWGVDALTKFAGQIAAAGLLMWKGGVVVLWLPLPGGDSLSLPSEAGVALTIMIVVAAINAVNFIDGLDGLAAGVIGIAAAASFSYFYALTALAGLNRQTVPALIAVTLAGICLGFLPHNFNPARIFMGDTGSMLIGLLLAASFASMLNELDPDTLDGKINRFGVALPLLIPFAVMVIPYADMLLAVLRRTYDGRSPFAPDRKHLHHRLLDLGHSQRRAALIMYVWTALFGFGVVGLSIVKSSLVVLAAASIGAMAVLAVGLMVVPRVGTRRRKRGRAKRERARAGRTPVPTASNPPQAGAPASPPGSQDAAVPPGPPPRRQSGPAEAVTQPDIPAASQRPPGPAQGQPAAHPHAGPGAHNPRQY